MQYSRAPYSYTFTTSCQRWLYIGMFFLCFHWRSFSSRVWGDFEIGIEWHLYNLLQKQTPLHTLSLHGSLFWRCDFDNNIRKAVKGMILLSGKYSQHRRYKPFVGHICFSVLILCWRFRFQDFRKHGFANSLSKLSEFVLS